MFPDLCAGPRGVGCWLLGALQGLTLTEGQGSLLGIWALPTGGPSTLYGEWEQTTTLGLRAHLGLGSSQFLEG